jgi:hypothetical protein
MNDQDVEEITNNDLRKKQFEKIVLIKNINSLDLVEILKTQNSLDIDFVVNYVLNKEYQSMPNEEDICIHDVLRMQPQLKKEDIIEEINRKKINVVAR